MNYWPVSLSSSHGAIHLEYRVAQCVDGLITISHHDRQGWLAIAVLLPRAPASSSLVDSWRNAWSRWPCGGCSDILWKTWSLMNPEDRHPRKYKSHPLPLANSAIIANHLRSTNLTALKTTSTVQGDFEQLGSDVDCWDLGVLHEHDKFLIVLDACMNKNEFKREYSSNLETHEKKIREICWACIFSLDLHF